MNIQHLTEMILEDFRSCTGTALDPYGRELTVMVENTPTNDEFGRPAYMLSYVNTFMSGIIASWDPNRLELYIRDSLPDHHSTSLRQLIAESGVLESLSIIADDYFEPSRFGVHYASGLKMYQAMN